LTVDGWLVLIWLGMAYVTTLGVWLVDRDRERERE
jgi:hypothetical protein